MVARLRAAHVFIAGGEGGNPHEIFRAQRSEERNLKCSTFVIWAIEKVGRDEYQHIPSPLGNYVAVYPNLCTILSQFPS